MVPGSALQNTKNISPPVEELRQNRVCSVVGVGQDLAGQNGLSIFLIILFFVDVFVSQL